MLESNTFVYSEQIEPNTGSIHNHGGIKMSHKTVFMGISASKLGHRFDPDKIAETVENIMKKYVEETAQEDDIKCDWYAIGGRWEGAIGALKGAENVLLTENGLFAYDFFELYDAIINNGQRGPYFVDDVEYIPINAGLKKDIAWDAVSKLDQYKTFKFLELVLNCDPRIGNSLPEGYEIKDGDLFGGKNQSLLLKKGEIFAEWVNRLGIQFDRALIPPDAYIDTKGIWHDENDGWAELEKKLMRGKLNEMPEDPVEAAQEIYVGKFEKFIADELKDNDCFVVLDCHCFP